jgi:hypothetical protein
MEEKGCEVMSKYSSGPWEVVQNGKQVWIDGKEGNQITPSCDIEYETDIPNHNLIAAAPDLLEALQWLMASRRVVDNEAWLIAEERAKQALRKAEGK